MDLLPEENDFLSEARVLNSDLGHHVKQCSFSTQLTGRFYENNSLESHKAKAKRIIRMKAKKKELERSVELEEKKIQYLETKRQEWEKRRLENVEKRKKMESAALRIQMNIRRRLARGRVERIRKEIQIMNNVASFIQSLFRGKRDRNYSLALKQKIIQHRKEELAAIRMQCSSRCIMARHALQVAKEEKKTIESNATRRVQALQRGRLCRKFLEKERQLRESKSATMIQSKYRGISARRRRDLLKRAKKIKRIPLHERRYSTYAFETPKKKNVLNRRRSSDFTGTLGKVLLNERRASVTGLEIVRMNNNKAKCRSVGHASLRSSDNTSLASSSMESESSRILKYRQKVAMRAMKLKRSNQNGNNPKLQSANNRKEELEKLEQKRKEILRRSSSRIERKEKSATKYSREPAKTSGNSNENKGSGSFSEKETLDTASSDVSMKINASKATVLGKTHFVIENDFDNFEDDFDENEDDLG